MNNNLTKELYQAGATRAEISSLVNIAGQLKRLSQQDNPGFWEQWKLRLFSGLAAVCLLLGGGSVAFAQTSMPGSVLYPTKKMSESVAVAIKPSYRATIMMRRSYEVQQLINHNADEHKVLSTLADYQTTANNYKASNYPAFEYCKDSLKQAAVQANPAERQAINVALAQLPDKD